jgi:hypothetical protein
MTLYALYRPKCPYVGLLNFCYTNGCVAGCILHQQSSPGEPAYYVILQKALPELGLYVTTARYYRSAYPPQGRWVFELLPAAFLLLLRASRGASATAHVRHLFLPSDARGYRLPARDLCKARKTCPSPKKVECRGLGELVD